MNFKTAFLTLSLAATPLLEAQQPNPQRILEGARTAATLTELPEGLSGNLNKGGRRVPLTLFLKGNNIQFNFTSPNGPEIFHMRFNQNSADLFEVVGGKHVKFPPAKLGHPVAGTDLTYEDLSLRFLYWQNPILEGVENVGSHPCYKLRLLKPRGAGGRYATVHVWIHTKYGAFMRVRGYNEAGGLLKEFQVEDVMEVGRGVWTLKKMQVATHDPRDGRRLGLTHVVFDTPRKVGRRPGGLR